jgi:hypothetical protein
MLGATNTRRRCPSTFLPAVLGITNYRIEFAGIPIMPDTHEQVVQKLIDLYHMLVCHNGFGEMSVDIRILKRGQKEVIIRCGKQCRFVVDSPDEDKDKPHWLLNWKHEE